MIDATLGEGGAANAFLSRFPDLSLVGIDADADILAVARERLSCFSDRVTFHRGWSQDFFANYPAGLPRPNAILADLGVSVFHYTKSGRGFAFSPRVSRRGSAAGRTHESEADASQPLDMRIDPTAGVPASRLLATMSEKEIADMLFANAGERYSRRIARAIVQARGGGGIETSAALSDLVWQAVPAAYRHGAIHPATRTFMALRIATNGELTGLSDTLEGFFRVLKLGGRLGIITFHSLEDRVVKRFFQKKSAKCACPPGVPLCRCGGASARLLTRKGLTADADEIERNPPSRSARLRVAEKIRDEGVEDEKTL